MFKRIFCCVKQISRTLLFLKLTFSPSENQRLEDDPCFFGGAKGPFSEAVLVFQGGYSNQLGKKVRNPTLKFGALNVVLTSWKVYNSLEQLTYTVYIL